MHSHEQGSTIHLPSSSGDESPVLYSLQGALIDLAIVFLASTALFVPMVLTGTTDVLLAWADAYPRLNLTELFLYGILLATGYSVANLRRWLQLTDLVRRHEGAERELRYQAARLEQSNRELERFAYVASHDLREPLRTIHSHLSLVERDAGDCLSANGRESLDFAREGAGRMDRMVKSLLTYARLERDEVRSRPVQAQEALEAARANLEVTAQRSRVRIEVGSLPRVVADGDEMILLFQNLLQNAIKHGRQLGARVRVGGTVEGDVARIWVEDEGPGIPPEQRERMFEVFRQGSHEDRAGGAGLGLSICQRVVERHGGRIWIEDAQSDRDEDLAELAPRAARRAGTRVVFELPAP